MHGRRRNCRQIGKAVYVPIYKKGWTNGKEESGIARRVVANLRYADDTTLIAGTKEYLIEIVERVRKKARKRDSIYEGHDYRIYWRGDSGREHRGVCIELHLSRSSKVSTFIHNKPNGFNDTSESNQQDKYSLDTERERERTRLFDKIKSLYNIIYKIKK